MESNASHSRPASVDSVHLGSTYSGFYPTVPPTGYHPQHQHHQPYSQHHQPQGLPSTGGIASSHQQNPQPNHHHHLQQHQHQSIPSPYYSTNHQQAQQASSSVSSSSSSLQYSQNLQQQPQQQPQQQHANPVQYPYPPYPPGPYGSAQQGAMMLSTGQQYQAYPPGMFQPINPTMALAASPSSTTSYPQQPLPQGPGAPFNQAWTSYLAQIQHQQQQSRQQYPPEFLNWYFKQYYAQWVHSQRQQQLAKVRVRTPLKYGSCVAHALATFSNSDNHLLVSEPNSRIAIYSLRDLFTDQCYPHLFLQSLLVHGPEDPSQLVLPFREPTVALDWIRVKLLNDSNLNYELKLILKVITMLFRQNGHVSGLDLSELLFELSPNAAEASYDSNAEKLSQSGSESVSRDHLLVHFRQMLMHGQRQVAHAFALNNGLNDHAFILACLNSFMPGSSANSSSNCTGAPSDSNGTAPSNQLLDCVMIISTVRKIVQTTLSTADPLYVLYSHLLQMATTQINCDPSATTAKIDSLDSFIILLANDIKFEKVEITNTSLRNLIDLMVALLQCDLDYVLPDELFHDHFDALLVNECLEFARFGGSRLNAKLALRKLEFAFELFDFGFVHHSVAYLGQIHRMLNADRKLVEVLAKSSRFSHFLLPKDEAITKQVWLYQMHKVLSRANRTEANFDCPLICGGEEEEEEEEEEVTEVVDPTESPEVPEDKTEEGDELTEEIVADDNDDDEEEEGEAEEISDGTSTLGGPLSPARKPEMPKQPNLQFKPEVAGNKREVEQPSLSMNASNMSFGVQAEGGGMANSTMIDPMDRRSMDRASLGSIGSSDFTFDASPKLRESKIVSGQFDSTHAQSSLASLPPIATDAAPPYSSPGQFPSGARRSLPGSFPPPPSARLNPIPESEPVQPSPSSTSTSTPFNVFEHSNNFHNQPKNEPPPSTTKSASTFDYSNPNPNPNPFGNMRQSMEGSLPRMDSTGSNGAEDTSDSVAPPALSQPPGQTTFFQPLPIPVDSNSNAPFDFISTNGQVTSIPAYDPYMPGDEPTPQLTADQLKNNQFLDGSNFSNGSIANNSNNSGTNSNNNNSNNNNNNNEDTKDSKTSKNDNSSNNGGLFNVLFGRLRPKTAILPDDKDPSIVYDPVAKRWVDKTAGDQGGATGAGLPPPPRIPLGPTTPTGPRSEPTSTLTSPVNQPSLPSLASFPSGDALKQAVDSNSNANFNSLPNGTSGPFGALAPPTSAGNMYRGSIRKNRYIDVFNAPKPNN